jgi:excisionase family DNA binding protein
MMTNAAPPLLPATVAAAPRWITLQQAAALLGVHPNTARRWADQAAVRSYRTIGGHRRLSADDVRDLAPLATPTPGAGAELDAELATLVEAVLRGELAEPEGRLRLRALGRRSGEAARAAGQRMSAALATQVSIRSSIGRLLTRLRAASGVGRSEVDERQWCDSLADAYLLGFAESADTVPSRARTTERRGDAAASTGRRDPPQ